MLPSPLAPGSSVYSIGAGNKTVGLLESRHQYVVGFTKPSVARYVMHAMAPEPQLVVLRRHRIDISSNLSSVLGVQNMNPVTIDATATLLVPKGPQGHESVYYMKTENMTRFLLHPFERNLGVIVPHTISYETDDNIELDAYVIDPASALLHFRQSLETMWP